jgi:hypothetical protein
MSLFTKVGIFVLVFLAWALFGLLPMMMMETPEKSGLVGDTFGAVNALFSGLAFAGLLITLMMQRDELKLQREELQLQREEMQQMRAEYARTAKAQEGSEAILRKQTAVAYFSAELQALSSVVDAHIARSTHGIHFSLPSKGIMTSDFALTEIGDVLARLRGVCYDEHGNFEV